MDDLTVVINSFDGYSDLWYPFFQVFRLKWPDCPYRVVLISNNKTFDSVDTIRVGEEINWTHRTLTAVTQIKTKYILLLLEDYLIGKTVDTYQIEQIVEYLEVTQGRYIRLTNYPKTRFSSNNEFFFPLFADEEYAINLQASIWEKDFLIECLNRCGGSAWEFEIEFLKNAVNSEHKVLEGCYGIKEDPLSVINGVLKGKWFPKAVKYCRKNCIRIDESERGKLTFAETLKYNFVVLLKSVISYSARKRIKRTLKKFGVKFVSKY